jgi:hypothetical protein
MLTINYKNRCPRVHWFSSRGISSPRFTAAWKKIWKLKKYKVHKFQNVRQSRTGHNMVKSSSPNEPSTWLIFLCPPYSHFHAELASILLLAFSLFTLVAALSHCLCSESPYLSIKLYCIYVCYMNITLYIAFSLVLCVDIYQHRKFLICEVNCNVTVSVSVIADGLSKTHLQYTRTSKQQREVSVHWRNIFITEMWGEFVIHLIYNVAHWDCEWVHIVKLFF